MAIVEQTARSSPPLKADLRCQVPPLNAKQVTAD
jgi:hypothetical protein